MKKFIGEVFWIRYEPKTKIGLGEVSASINRAILNDNIFKIDFTDSKEAVSGEISLRSKDGYQFDGSSKYSNEPKSSGMVNLTYYMNQDHALLIGNWVEDKVEFTCIIKLEEVEEFKN